MKQGTLWHKESSLAVLPNLCECTKSNKYAEKAVDDMLGGAVLWHLVPWACRRQTSLLVKSACIVQDSLCSFSVLVSFWFNG